MPRSKLHILLCTIVVGLVCCKGSHQRTFTVACPTSKNPLPYLQDLLAVGYGALDFNHQGPGLLAFWSLANPTYPLLHFPTTHTVTSVDFSNRNGNLLAVGLYDGTLCVYDVKSKSPQPAVASDASTGKHTDPVWQVCTI